MCFLHHDKTINHLFFWCQFVRSIWSVTQIGSTLYPPRNVVNIFGNRLSMVDHGFKTFIRVRTVGIIWSLWLCRNNKVFNDKHSSLLPFIYRCTASLRLWSLLQRMENRNIFMEVCTRLKDAPKDVFLQHGWRRNLQIVLPCLRRASMCCF
jgi:hypothetical protein